MPRALVVLIACLALTSAAPAHGEPPESTEVVVIVRGAAAQRTSPAGTALAALARESGRLADLEKAWADFAAALGWSTEEAFDGLLGSRAMLVLRGVSHTGAEHWALLSEVTPDAERRLTTSLQPAPRGRAGDYTVLAIERGRFELAIARGGWRDDAPRPAVILLAPGADSELFDELVPLLSAPRFAGGDDGDLSITIRRPVPPPFTGGPPRTSTTTVSASLTADGFGWDCRLLGDPGRALAPITPWSTAVFEGLQQGSTLTVMGVLGAPPISGLREWVGLPPVTLPEGSRVGERVALVVRGTRARASGLAGGAGTARAVAHAPRDTPAPSVTFAVEARDLPGLIPAADTLAASLVPFLSGHEHRAQPPLAMVEFDPGLEERSVRAVELFPEKGSLVSGFGPAPVLTWAFARSRPSFGHLAGIKTERSAAPGWWVMSLTPAAGAGTPTRTVRDLLARELPDPLQMQRLSVGVVRPADLERASDLPPEIAGSLRGWRWVESVRWDSWLRPDGQIEGEVRVRMSARP